MRTLHGFKSIVFIGLVAGLQFLTPSWGADCPGGPSFRRGDINADGFVDASDVVYLLDYLFRGGDPLCCPEAGEINMQPPIDLSDGVTLIGYLYLGWSPPPEPFPGCGPAEGECFYPESLCTGDRPAHKEDPSLHLAFVGPQVIEGPPSTQVHATVVGTLDNSFEGAPAIEGWNLCLRSIPVESLAILGFSTEDTVTQGQRPPTPTTGPGNEGVITVGLLGDNLLEPLPVDQPPYRLISLDLLATVPPSGCIRCQLSFQDGLKLFGVVHDNFLISRGRRFDPFSRSLEIMVCATVPSLALGVPRDFTLTPAAPEAIFRIDPLPVIPLLILIEDEDPQDANTLYAAWSRIPSPLSFDASAARKSQAGQRLIIPESRGGSLYFLVQGLSFNDGENHLRLLVLPQDLFLQDISADCGAQGCSGAIQVKIRGAGFDSRTAFFLERPPSPPVAAGAVNLLGDDRAEALFDLTGVAEGEYDLVARRIEGGVVLVEDRLRGAVKVAPPRIGPRLEVELQAPAYYRPGRLRELKVVYSNTGDEEMPAPYLRLVGPPQATFRLSATDEDQQGSLDFLGIHQGGIAGTLPPGGQGEIIVLFRTTSPSDVARFEVQRLVAGPGDGLDWSSLSAPTGVSQVDWDLVRPHLAESLGSSWLEYHEALARQATRSARLDLPASGALDLWRFAFHEALRGSTGSVSGKARDVSGLPLASRLVAAKDVTGTTRTCVLTGPEGQFSLSLLAPGSYTLFLETFQAAGPQVSISPGEDLFGIAFTPQEPGQAVLNCPSPAGIGLPAVGAPLPSTALFQQAAAAEVTPVLSIDPNEKEGPGEGLPIDRGQPIRYTIYFENQGAATAAVQKIDIIDVLDPRLDPLSVVLDPIQLSNDPGQLLTFPLDETPGATYRFVGATSQVVQIPYPESTPTEVMVDFQATTDPEARVLHWTIQAHNPTTGKELNDPRAGILPPNDASHRGEGHLSFTVKTNPGTPLADTIQNQATISFDDGMPIPTGTVRNLVGPAETVKFRRGDVNQDGDVDLSDAIFLFDYLFLAGRAVRCLDAADANDDGTMAPDISDGIYLLDFLFLGGPVPGAPGPKQCGYDPPDIADFMECAVYDRC
jgi:hypothetical protein